MHGPSKGMCAILVTGILLLAGCGNDPGGRSRPDRTGDGDGDGPTASAEGLFDPAIVNQPVHEGTPARGGSITFGLESDIVNVSPNQSIVQAADVQVATAVYDPLIGFDTEGFPVTDNADRSRNQLAETLTSTDDMTVWTLTLRDDVSFSNGEPLTAQQVVDQTEWVKASGTCDCDEAAQMIVDVEATDDHTVVYRLDEPVVDWPVRLARGGLAWITESGARAEADDPANPGIEHLIGTGAFVFAEKSGDSWVVERNEHYHGVDPENGDAPLPYLDSITFLPLADSVTRLQAVQSDSVQIMQTADTANLVDAKKDGTLGVQPAQGTSSTIFGFNLTGPPFGVDPEPDEEAQQTAIRSLDDPTALAARQAVAYATNRNEINQKSYEGTRVPAYGFLPPENPWFDPDGQLPRFDLARATELVTEVTDAGVPVDIDLLCINTPQAKGMFDLFEQQLEAAGFRVTQHTVEQSVLVQNLLAGAGDIDWNLACLRSPQFTDPNALANPLGTGGTVNFAKYSRADVDEWLDEARRTADTAERKAFYDRIQQQAATDVVYMPTLFDYYGNVFRDGISGLSAPLPVSLGVIAPGMLYRVD